MTSSETLSEKKTKKKEKFSFEQLQCFCDYVRQNHGKLFGQAQTPCDRVEDGRKLLWEELARQLAALGCPGMTAKKLRQSWSELKKRANEYNKKKHQTGGGKVVKNRPKLELVLGAMREKAKHGIRGQDAETGASEQPMSQNTAACSMLLHMGQQEESEGETGEAGREAAEAGREAAEAGGEAAEAGGEAGEPEATCVAEGDEEDVVLTSTTKHKKRCTRYDQHTEYQERLLQVQQEMLRTQQAMLQTFNNMLGILQQFVNGHQ